MRSSKAVGYIDLELGQFTHSICITRASCRFISQVTPQKTRLSFELLSASGASVCSCIYQSFLGVESTQMAESSHGPIKLATNRHTPISDSLKLHILRSCNPSLNQRQIINALSYQSSWIVRCFGW